MSIRRRYDLTVTYCVCGRAVQNDVGSSSWHLKRLWKGKPAKQFYSCSLHGVRENMCTERVNPYPNRNGSPGRETAVDGVTYVREFGKLDL